MYKKILVATDGSEISQRAAQHAITLAKGLGASLSAVFVIDTRAVPGVHPLVPESMAPYYFSLIEELRKAGQAAIDSVTAEASKSGLSLEAAVIEGVPAMSIIEAAKRFGADLIVVGTHGRTGFGALLLGSTAQALVHSTHTPVLLVR